MSETLNRAPFEKYRDLKAQEAQQSPDKPEDIDWFKVSAEELKAQNEAEAQIETPHEPLLETEVQAPADTVVESQLEVTPEVEAVAEPQPAPVPQPEVHTEANAKKRTMSNREISQRVYRLNKLVDVYHANKLLDTTPKNEVTDQPVTEVVASEPNEAPVVTEIPLQDESSEQQAVPVHIDEEAPVANEEGLTDENIEDRLIVKGSIDNDKHLVEQLIVEDSIKDDEATPPVTEPVVAPAETTAEATKIADEEPEVIPEEVIAAVASTMKRADFVKQQEDLFGANDEIAPEDVPKGEKTWAEYLAERPVAEEGDFYHHNGRVYNAAPGGPKQHKKEIYEDQLNNSSADEYYQKLESQANRDAVYDEASTENETKNKAYDSIIRTNVEGEFLVKKDPRLQGLLALGEELLELYNSELTGEEFEKQIRPTLEAKRAIYDDLYELYQSKAGIDARALGFIADKTGSIEDPDFIPVEGSAYFNGERVEVVNFEETDDLSKIYTVEKSDGSVEAVEGNDVEFRREFEEYEAPEEEKLSRFDRIKNWFGKENKKRQEFGGKAYWAGVFSTPGNWLHTRRIESGMSELEIQEQKEKNRVRAVLGLAAISAIAVTARYAGLDHGGTGDFMASIFDTKPEVDVSVDTTGTGSEYPSARAVENIAEANRDPMVLSVPGQEDVRLGIPGYDASIGQSSVSIDNPAFNIPDGGKGLDLFRDLGLGVDKWNANAQDLANRFPDSFYREGNDVRLMESGMLPAEVRQYISTL